jgi:Peptidase MA superfamily/Tetratricopeptide repeat
MRLIVRASVILFLLSAFVAITAAGSSAEVIHLKNGRTIWAEHVRESGAQIEYDLGDNSYAIPKSLVERIETGGSSPAATSGTGAKDTRDLPTFVPMDNLANDPALIDQVIRDGRVDDEGLAALEQSGKTAKAAAGYYIAGKHEFDHGNFPKARTYLDTALRLDGQNPSILNYYSVLLVKTGNAPEALPYAERAVRLAPDSADTLTVLGYVQFAADRDQDAIRTWKRSLEIRPDGTVQKLLERAQRDANAQANYSERESNHFNLHYEGQQTSEAFREQLLATLESEYDDLVRQLGNVPRTSIPVVLYTNQTFFDVTQAPSWTGALNDGKLRIPVQGVSSVTPDLARVLKHELAHSFINQLTAARCPQWLNEGIAQAVEPKPLANGNRLAQLYKQQREIPLNALEGSFVQFSAPEAVVAYEESLAAVQYINDTYGMSDLQRILERLGQGSSTEAALRATLHSDYGQLETEVGKYLAGRYGN